jgi:hypothetical protein
MRALLQRAHFTFQCCTTELTASMLVLAIEQCVQVAVAVAV